MWVTLPFLLLVLDWWPLQRFRVQPNRTGFSTTSAVAISLVREKIPLFALSALSCVITWIAQRESAASSLEQVSAAVRIANTLISYSVYLLQCFWPVGLAPFYPLHVARIAWPGAAISALFLAVVTGAVFAQRRQRPYLLVGWLWYLGTLVPVIGLIQVGGQARADRYTYLPTIGLCIMLVWGLDDLLSRYRLRTAGLISAGSAIMVLVVLCHRQAGLWHDDIKLWKHTLAVTNDNWTAHFCLGAAEEQAGHAAEARAEFDDAFHLAPNFPAYRSKYSLYLLAAGKSDAARECLEQGLASAPHNGILLTSLGVVYQQAGDVEQAQRCYESALAINNDISEAHTNLAVILRKRGDSEEALDHLRRAIKIDPKNHVAHFTVGAILQDRGERSEAIEAYRRALSLDPNSPLYQRRLREAQAGGGQ
jgi:Flp pilus assembly protein TadD